MKTLIALLLAGATLAPIASLAHGDKASFETASNGYTVDIGYGTARAGDRVTFDFNLSDATSGPMRFDSVWVQISKDAVTHFAGPIATLEFGVPSMSIVFGDAGVYDVSARFSQGLQTLVEADFPLTVSSAGVAEGSTRNFMLVIIALVLSLASFILGMFYTRHV